MAKPLAVYDGHTGRRLAFLQNAHAIRYSLKPNTLWTASFTLPYSDPKTKYCTSFNNVEIWDTDAGGRDRYIGLFRIMPQTEDTIGVDGKIEYALEHVVCTLLDDVMLGHHEIGNKGVYTENVIGYILSKQTNHRWNLKECDYRHEFLYGWQDENLLSALFSVVQPFAETDYYWDYDTLGSEWYISLKKTVKEPKADIRYKKNLSGLTRIVDPTNLTTRLYCYGYGQGDNKLNIADVNGGQLYLESPNVNKYGVITQIWTDERFTVAESLLDVGKAMLKRLEEPRVSYEIDLQTIYSAGNLTIGDTVRIVSSGIDELMTVKEISKEDVTGAPMSGRILLGEGTIDVTDSLAELAERQRIAETYSQGAESIFTDSFVDNADADNPAEVTFAIPQNTVHVNEVRFTCSLKPFRAYSRAVDGGGMEGLTTEDGGDEIESTEFATPMLATTDTTTPSQVSSFSGGQAATTTSSSDSISPTTTSEASVITTYGASYTVGFDGNHNHGIRSGTELAVKGGGSVFWAPSGGHTHNIGLNGHSHTVYIDGHNHSVYISPHTHFIPGSTHSHTIDAEQLRHKHNITINPHKHTWALPNHTHNIEYGIYKGPAADKIKVYLDDKYIGEYESGVRDVNLIDYMSKNANGDILRGSHTIKIIPDGLTRVECTFLIRLFTNALGGKQY